MTTGLGFTLLSSVQDIMDPRLFPDGPWVHLARVVRALPGGQMKEYVAFKRLYEMDVWVEEFIESGPYWSSAIEDENEWRDIVAFLTEAQLLHIGLDIEVKLGHKLADYMEKHYQDPNAPNTLA